MKVSRRTFLGSAATAAGGALVIGFTFRDRFHFGRPRSAQEKPPENPFEAWIHIKPDNSADLVFAQSEMGQGVYTALPMLLGLGSRDDCPVGIFAGNRRKRQRHQQLRESAPRWGRGSHHDDCGCGSWMGSFSGGMHNEQERGHA